MLFCIILTIFHSPIGLLPGLDSLLRRPHNLIVNRITNHPMDLSPGVIPPQIANWRIPISKTSNDSDEILQKLKTRVSIE
jgi:hypothetical protein